MIDRQQLNEAEFIRNYPAGQRVTAADPGVPEMYVVLSGCADIYAIAQGRATPAGVAGPGESFGGPEFLGSGQVFAYRAKQALSVYVVTENVFHHLAKAKPGALLQIMKSIFTPQESAKAAPAAAAPTPQKSAQPQVAVGEGGSALAAASPDFFPQGHKGYPGVFKPEYKKFVIEKEYKCPVCGKAFKGAHVLQSRLSTCAPTRYDMREFYTDFQMAWYDVVTCAHCYFSALAAYFLEPKGFFKARAQEALKDVKQRVTLDLSRERDLDTVFAMHQLALLGVSGFMNHRQITAKLWSNISWLYEDAEDEAMAKYAAGEAARAFESIFVETTMSPGQEQIVCLSAAGMLYRAGQTGEVKRWLYNVKTNREGKKTYADLADRLLDMIKDVP